MAKIEKKVHGNFNTILNGLHKEIMDNSVSASFEDSSSYICGSFRSEVRVYERFSYAGGNRLSMTVMLSGADGEYLLSVITAGGSQALFFKINTWGENSFLDTIRDYVEKLK